MAEREEHYDLLELHVKALLNGTTPPPEGDIALARHASRLVDMFEERTLEVCELHTLPLTTELTVYRRPRTW